MLNELIKYFVYKTKGHITKTQLVKFLYLADLYAVKWTGKQLTQLDWYRYNYGPWHEDIDRALAEMEGKEITQVSGDGKFTLIQPIKQNVAFKSPQIPLGLELVLSNIRKEWAGTTGDRVKDLLDYVYNTEPMKAVKDCDPSKKVTLDLQKERERLVNELKK